EHDAPQCGFCTSGQLMSAKWVTSRNPHPTKEEVQKGMTGNICRCSNYNRYVEAALASTQANAVIPAVEMYPAGGTPLPVLKTVNRPTPRIDAMERVTGKAAYTLDVKLPGMLYAKVLRSPHPHARIRKIDTSKASAMAGVKAVITHENGAVV